MLYDPKWEKLPDLSTKRGVLIAARELIKDPKRWCGRAPMSKADGNCAATAIWTAAHNRTAPGGPADAAYYHLASTMGVKHPKDFNDTHNHAEVLAMFDRAIETA